MNSPFPLIGLYLCPPPPLQKWPSSETYQIYNLRFDFGIIEQRRWRQMRLKLPYSKRRTAGCRTGTHCFLNRVQILQVPIQKLCDIDLQVYRVDVPTNFKETLYQKKKQNKKKNVCVCAYRCFRSCTCKKRMPPSHPEKRDSSLGHDIYRPHPKDDRR